MKNLLRFLFLNLMLISLATMMNKGYSQNASMTVPYLTNELTIDGNIDDWPLEIEYVPLENYINKVEGWVVEGVEFSKTPFDQSDLSAQMLVAHDLKYFYIFIEVMDDIDGVQADTRWKSDNVEFFFNPDLGNDLPFNGTDKNYTGSDGITDAIQHGIARDTTINQGMLLSPNWVTRYWDYKFMVNNQTTGYTVEVKVPLDSVFTDHTNIADWVPDGHSLGLPIKEGLQFGFEVMITDYDNTAQTADAGNVNRDGHLCWSNSSGNDLAYMNTGLFGTITLGSKTSSIENRLFENKLVLQNPVYDMIRLKGENRIRKIELFNITGTEVLSLDKPTSEINISNLERGIYLLKAYGRKGQITIEKIYKH